MELNTAKVGQVIIMARELHRAEGELRAFIDRFGVDEQAELVALMWIGRGSFDVQELDEAIAMAQSEASTPTADYLIGTPHLADHLEAALDALGVSAISLENELM